jgi:hypothetical protein
MAKIIKLREVVTVATTVIYRCYRKKGIYESTLNKYNHIV